MFERGERDQYQLIGKGGHPPLQAFLGPGCGCANTRAHFAQFLLRLFGGGTDVLGDAFRSRFFWSHDFILSTLLLILHAFASRIDEVASHGAAGNRYPESMMAAGNR
jgi:hypothetical protein